MNFILSCSELRNVFFLSFFCLNNRYFLFLVSASASAQNLNDPVAREKARGEGGGVCSAGVDDKETVYTLMLYYI